MSEMKSYVAVVDFNMSLNNGKESIKVTRGQVLSFDGLYVDMGDGTRGTARPLSKMIGEWVVPYQQQVPQAPRPQSRTAVAGRDSIEQSNEYQDYPVTNAGRDPSLERDIQTYEDRTYGKTGKLIQDDSSVVSQVRQASNSGAVKNTSGVQIGEQSTQAGTVVSQEERVVKETSYNGPQVVTQQEHLKVVNDEVVAKQTASNPTVEELLKQMAALQQQVLNLTRQTTVSQEERVVKETSSIAIPRTDVGSSTQAQVVQSRVATEQQRVVIKSPNKKIVEDNEGVIVKKVKNTNVKVDGGNNGISIKTAVVPEDTGIENANVTYGGNAKEIYESDTEFSGTGAEVVDASSAGPRQGVHVAKKLDSGIDVDELLGAV